MFYLPKLIISMHKKSLPKPRRISPGLLVPLPSQLLPPSSPEVLEEASMILEDILGLVFSKMHIVDQSLNFWLAKHQGSNAQKAYCMLFERGPRAFLTGTADLVRNLLARDSSLDALCSSASDFIATRVSFFSGLKHVLAKFLAKVYMIISNHREELMCGPRRRSLPQLFIIIDDLFSDLAASIAQLPFSSHQMEAESSSPTPLLFDRITERQREVLVWTDDHLEVAADSIHQNLQKLDSYLSDAVLKHGKPTKLTRHWVRYTFGAMGLSVCSLWLVGHSRLVGCSDIDNWVYEAKDSTIKLWTKHVKQPFLTIIDGVCNPSRQQNYLDMGAEEVDRAANSLYRLLLSTNGQELPKNASNQQLLELHMTRYKNAPIETIVDDEELSLANFIKAQELYIDLLNAAKLRMEMLQKACEFDVAASFALRTSILTCSLVMPVCLWMKRAKSSQASLALHQRRLLIEEAEEMILQHQHCIELGQVEDAQCCYGLMLYNLDLLYHAVEKHAKAIGEWSRLKKNIIDLTKPELDVTHKVALTCFMIDHYFCLLPSRV